MLQAHVPPRPTHAVCAQQVEQGFMYRSYQNSEGQITRVFFEVDDAIEEWSRCADNVLLFDTKFGTNRVGMKLGLFCTVGHTGQTVILAACLVEHEDYESFHWAFSAVGDLLRMPPTVFMTDGDPAISRAVKSLSGDLAWFSTARHLLCVFHLFKNFYEHIHPLFHGNKEEWKVATSLFWNLAKESDNRMQDSFDDDSAELKEHVKEHGHGPSKEEAIEWLDTLLARSHQWAYRFCMQHFSAGVHSTSRAESKNAKVRRLVNSHTLLTKLVEMLLRDNASCQKQRDVSDWRKRLRHEQHKESQLPVVAKELGKITEFAYDLLTSQGMQAMQYEVREQEGSAAVPPDGGTPEPVYTVTRIQGKQDADDLTLADDGYIAEDGFPFEEEYGLIETSSNRWTTCKSCSCQYATCFGLPCRHMIRVYVHLQLRSMPPNVIQRKWRAMSASEVEMAASALRAKPRPSRRHRASEQAAQPSSLSVEDRRALVLRETQALVEAASKSDEVCYFLKNAVRHLAAQAQGMQRGRGARVDTSAANASGISYMPFAPHVQVAVPLDQSLDATNLARAEAVFAEPSNGDPSIATGPAFSNARRGRMSNGRGRGGRGGARNTSRAAASAASAARGSSARPAVGRERTAPAAASAAATVPASAATQGQGRATAPRASHPAPSSAQSATAAVSDPNLVHAAVEGLASATCTGHGTGSASDTGDPDDSDDSCEYSTSDEEEVTHTRGQGDFIPNLAPGSRRETRCKPNHGPTSGTTKPKRRGKTSATRRGETTGKPRARSGKRKSLSDGNPVRKKKRAKDYRRD